METIGAHDLCVEFNDSLVNGSKGSDKIWIVLAKAYAL